MARFKGEGVISNCMGQAVAEFVNGELITDDPDKIAFLRGKGYVPEVEASVRAKPVVSKE
jgi:hypothetical protein